MTSVVTTYFYTLLAMGAIGLMLTTTFQAHTSSLHVVSERQELRGLLENIASEGTELIALTEATNASVRVCLRLPRAIGNRLWWARLVSDPTGTWIEGAFGSPWAGHPESRVDLPMNVTASGTYEGGVGTLALTCSKEGGDISLILGAWEAK